MIIRNRWIEINNQTLNISELCHFGIYANEIPCYDYQTMKVQKEYTVSAMFKNGTRQSIYVGYDEEKAKEIANVIKTAISE